MKLLILNGPNLNLLGKREPGIYGSHSFEDYFKELQDLFSTVKLTYYQSNIEGELLNMLHKVDDQFDGVILNAGAYTHTSIALGDAIRSIQTPVVEVHISNTFARESFRHHSYISAHVKGIIIGFGLESYKLAIRSFLS